VLVVAGVQNWDNRHHIKPDHHHDPTRSGSHLHDVGGSALVTVFDDAMNPPMWRSSVTNPT
jgi:hypothetical protein